MEYKRFINPFHPGEILLEEFIAPRGISQRQVARALGWTPKKLNEIVKGKRGISAKSAIMLARYFGTTPEIWLNMQQVWDLDQAYRALEESGQAA